MVEINEAIREAEERTRQDVVKRLRDALMLPTPEPTSEPWTENISAVLDKLIAEVQHLKRWQDAKLKIAAALEREQAGKAE